MRIVMEDGPVNVRSDQKPKEDQEKTIETVRKFCDRSFILLNHFEDSGFVVACPVSILKLIYAHSNEHVGSILVGHICLEWDPHGDNDCSCDEKSTEYCAADVVTRWGVNYYCDSPC
jgi:hypothetical protein